MPRDALLGPERAPVEEIDRINRVFSEAFTDRYQRDGLSGVRVPLLNPVIWKFAISTAGEGALVWRDSQGAIAAFNMVHRSGSEGWMGPLAVRPDCQRQGMGTRIVREGIRRLEAAGARTIGLETMPRTMDNIGFYSRIGFRPGYLTVSVTRELTGQPGSFTRRRPGPVRDGVLEACRSVAGRLMHGADFSREIEVTAALGLGDVTTVWDDGKPAGFALWHTAPLAEGRPGDEARVLKLAALDTKVFARLIAATEADTAAAGARQLSVRCQTAFRDAYEILLESGYTVHWTDLRMTLRGRHEPTMDGAVLFSNWEI